MFCRFTHVEKLIVFNKSGSTRDFFELRGKISFKEMFYPRFLSIVPVQKEYFVLFRRMLVIINLAVKGGLIKIIDRFGMSCITPGFV